MISSLEALLREDPRKVGENDPESAAADRPDGASAPRPSVLWREEGQQRPARQDRGERRQLYTEDFAIGQGQCMGEGTRTGSSGQRREVMLDSAPRLSQLDRGERSRSRANEVPAESQHMGAAIGPVNQPVQPHRQSMIKLHRYNGEEPADTFLLQVQLAAQINRWSDEETAGHVALSLEGKALQILTDLRPAELRDWLKLKGAI